MTTYEVIGKRGYRGYDPGEFFEATLDPGAEARGLQRRNIRIVNQERPALQPGTYTLPKGWADNTGRRV